MQREPSEATSSIFKFTRSAIATFFLLRSQGLLESFTSLGIHAGLQLPHLTRFPEPFSALQPLCGFCRNLSGSSGFKPLYTSRILLARWLHQGDNGGTSQPLDCSSYSLHPSLFPLAPYSKRSKISNRELFQQFFSTAQVKQY